MTNRTSYESKQDLQTAADSVGFRATFLVPPTQISKAQLPLFAVYSGVELQEIEDSNAREGIYSGKYEFSVAAMWHTGCAETQVIADFDAYMTKLIDNTNTSGYYPFELTRLRRYIGEWGQYEGWIVEATFLRTTCEDFQ